MSSAPQLPVFPPLFSGETLSGQADPFAKACTQAMLGCDSGLVVHNISVDRLRAAIVFAPETPLEQAAAVFIACGIGFQNALGALAPPEVAVHLGWSGNIFVNGARCGNLRIAASTDDPAEVPNWIVVGLDLPLIPADDVAPGDTPDETCLFEEGCVEVEPVRLLEAWVRHSLVWINRMEDEGNAPLHAEWRGLARDLGEEVSFSLAGQDYAGTFMGVDEHFNMLLRQGKETGLVRLTACLDRGDTL